jgi:NAD(P)-dependent dehydrogenase (short-subunit alcohol dehydrogenase family)
MTTTSTAAGGDAGPRVFVITGAARGIGLGLARHFAGLGHAVVMNDAGVTLDGRPEDEDLVHREAAALRAAGGRVHSSSDSVARPETAAALAELAVREFGGLDVWINGASILRGRMLFQVPDEDWREAIDVALHGTFFGTRAALRHMRERRAGRVINLISAAGVVGNLGVAGYGAAKAGITGLSRVAALEVKRQGVAVNAVIPFARTRMTDIIPGGTPEVDAYLAGARAARVEHLMPFFEFLALEAGPEITGQIFAARGHEVMLMDQPRPVVRIGPGVSGGWTQGELRARFDERVRPALVPLETEFTVFGGELVV